MALTKYITVAEINVFIYSLSHFLFDLKTKHLNVKNEQLNPIK